MQRKSERTLIKIMGIWQIIDGLMTIFIYGFYRQQSQLGLAKGITFGNTQNRVFLFICTFGTLLISFGIANLLASKRYIKDNEPVKKIAVFIIGQALFSYFILDIISLVLGMTAGIISLAKNKSIRLNHQKI